MLKESHAFSGFAVNDIAATKQFYRDVLDITVEDNNGMGLILKLVGGNEIFIYEKPDHVPAGFTILNFPVTNIDTIINDLAAKGVSLERYEGMAAEQDDKGVLRGKATGDGPDIAWFKDPSGNILSILEE